MKNMKYCEENCTADVNFPVDKGTVKLVNGVL